LAKNYLKSFGEEILSVPSEIENSKENSEIKIKGETTPEIPRRFSLAAPWVTIGLTLSKNYPALDRFSTKWTAPATHVIRR